jgi:hypothetical protein
MRSLLLYNLASKEKGKGTKLGENHFEWRYISFLEGHHKHNRERGKPKIDIGG